LQLVLVDEVIAATTGVGAVTVAFTVVVQPLASDTMATYGPAGNGLIDVPVMPLFQLTTYCGVPPFACTAKAPSLELLQLVGVLEVRVSKSGAGSLMITAAVVVHPASSVMVTA
jgi:hypothetical protein